MGQARSSSTAESTVKGRVTNDGIRTGDDRDKDFARTDSPVEATGTILVWPEPRSCGPRLGPDRRIEPMLATIVHRGARAARKVSRPTDKSRQIQSAGKDLGRDFSPELESFHRLEGIQKVLPSLGRPARTRQLDTGGPPH